MAWNRKVRSNIPFTAQEYVRPSELRLGARAKEDGARGKDDADALAFDDTCMHDRQNALPAAGHSRSI